ncbi:MAG: exo-alpha-sialidase [Phycisphaeraceae bacterium]
MRSRDLFRCVVAGGVCAAFSPASAQVELNVATDVMTAGQEGYAVYRIPGFAIASDGSLLLFAEGRPNQSDPGAAGDIDLVYKRSADAGQTWSGLTALRERPGFDFSDPRVVIDDATGQAHLLYVQWPTLCGQACVPTGLSNNSSVVYHHVSADHGATWSAPTSINTQVKDPAWASLNTGPGLGIQLKWQDADPSRNGRLVVPGHHRPTAYRGVAIYSDDGGATWSSGTGSTPHFADESEIIELTNGDLLWDARVSGSGRNRSISSDGGQTWVNASSGDIPVSAVDTGMVRYSAKRAGDDRDRILYSAPLGTPAGAGNGRTNIGVWTSYDEGKTFINPVQIEPGSAAYSVIDKLNDGSVGLVYEVDHNTIRYVNFDLDALEGGAHSQDLTHYDDFGNPIDPSKGGIGWSGAWQVGDGVGYAGGNAITSFSTAPFDLGFTLSMNDGGGAAVTIDPGVVPNERANGIYGQVFTTIDQAGPVTQITVQRADTGSASPASVYLHVYSDLDPTDGVTPGTFLGSSLAAQSLNPTDSGVTTWAFDGVSAVLAPNTPYFFGFANSPTPGDITTARAALFEPLGNESGLAFAPLVEPGSLGFDDAGRSLPTSGDHLRLRDTAIQRGLSRGVDMDRNGVFYTSLLVSRAADTGSDDAAGERLAVMLSDSAGTASLGFGIDSDESFFIQGLGPDAHTPANALDLATTYLLLFKVVTQDDAANGNADQLFFKAFASGQALPGDEAGMAWDLVSDASVNADALFNQIAIAAGPGALWSVDEVRLGETYEAVVLTEPRYTLSYDSATGELLIDTLGGPIMNYVLEATGFVEENHAAVLAGTKASTDQVLSESSLTPTSGLLNLGAVLPANLGTQSFNAWFTNTEYVPELGAPKAGFQLVYLPLPGDTDGDADIDDSDLGTAFANYTGPLTPNSGGKTAAQGDTDGDGDIDDSDLGTIFAAYTGPLSPTSVPEPASATPVIACGLLLRRRRRDRKGQA